MLKHIDGWGVAALIVVVALIAAVSKAGSTFGTTVTDFARGGSALLYTAEGYNPTSIFGK